MAVAFSIVSALGVFRFVDVPIQFSPYCLVPDFPVVIWVALFSVILGLLIVLTKKTKQDDAIIAIAIIALVAVFYGIMVISERNLTYPDSWLNISTAKTIFENGNSRLAYGAYNSWPSFFILFVELRMVTGIDFTMIARFLPSILNCLAFVWIFIFLRKLGLPNKAALIAVVAFILVNDRVYTIASPTNFVFALYCMLLYLMFVKKQTSPNQSYLMFLLLFATIVTSHALIPGFLLLPMLVFSIMAFVFKQNNKVRLGYEFFLGTILWVFWNVFMIAPFWWEDIASNVQKLFSHVSTLSSPISRSLSYFKFGYPPLEIQVAQLSVIGFIFLLSCIGFFGYLRQYHAKIRARNTREKYWLRFFAPFSVLVGCVLTAIIPYFLLGGSIETDKVLLFIWIPAVFFVGTVFVKLKRKQKQVFSILLVLLLIPAFAIFNWNEFWLSNHDWELSSFSFMAEKVPSATIITDSASATVLHYFSPNSTFVTDGVPEKPGLALPAFLGSVPPTEIKSQYEPTLIQWNYFLRSVKQNVRLNIYFGTQNETLSKLDTFFSNVPINRVYDDEFVQLYQRNQ